MPTHTVPSALVSMYFDDPGAPWKFPAWQKLTGFNIGLLTDNSSPLPPGWDQSTVASVVSYFDQYNQKEKLDAKIKFAAARRGASSIPGREIWRKFTNDLWKKHSIHAKITTLLTAHSNHPIQVARATRSGNTSLAHMPSGKDYASQMIDPVGRALFGTECFDTTGLHVDYVLNTSIRAIILRTWINIKNQTQRTLKRIGKVESDAMEAFNELEEDKATKIKVKKVIVKIARWKALAEALAFEDHIERMLPMTERLQAIMFRLGASIQEPSEKARAAAAIVNDKMLASLISEGDMEDVVNFYRDFFDGTSLADSVDLIDQRTTITTQFGLNNGETTDLGIGIESEFPPEILALNLGYDKLLPLAFLTFYHTEGRRAWNEEHQHLWFKEDPAKNSDMKPIALHWHQLAGVHAILRMNFTPMPTNEALGCLIADEVGLGKTFLCAAVIAFLCDVVTRQTLMSNPSESTVVSLPAILRDGCYLGKYEVLPALPHLILVPGTLLAQWLDALQTLFRPRMFDILTYPTGKKQREHFWGPNGPLHMSRARGNIIILASHSALQQDFSSLYSWSKPAAHDPDNLPWESTTTLPDYANMVNKTLYGQQYLSVCLDEAQGFRNAGVKHCAALYIMNLAVMRLPMTATPIQTSTKDAASMGRLLGIQHFLSKAALVEEKEDASLLRQIKRTFDGAENNPDCPSQELLDAQTKIIQRMQVRFENRILRRTRDSLNWKKAKLIDLPACHDISIIVKPTAREMEMITQHANNVKESASSSNGVLQICSKDFYIGHRMCIAYARTDLAEKIPYFATLEQWEPKKSTKFDICARLCNHILSRDDAPQVEVVDGQVVFPPLPSLGPDVIPSKTTKILISQSYPSLGPLLRNVLDLYGINFLYIDGNMSFDKRAKIVSKFINDTSCRVLIMSSVGSVGLNLTVASVIIFVDQVWSAQDELQIRGRAHRQPQKKEVLCYHILADETADIVLAALARGKHHMMEAFLSQEQGKEMMDLLSGKSIANPEDDLDMDEDPAYMHASKPQKKKKKSNIVMSDEETQQAKPPKKFKYVSLRSKDSIDQGASPPRGEEDIPTYRDTAHVSDGLTDDQNVSSMSDSGTDFDSSRLSGTSGDSDPVGDFFQSQISDDDISMDASQPSQSLHGLHITPPRQQQQQALARKATQDSPELARTRKRAKNSALASIDYSSSPSRDCDPDISPMKSGWQGPPLLPFASQPSQTLIQSPTQQRPDKSCIDSYEMDIDVPKTTTAALGPPIRLDSEVSVGNLPPFLARHAHGAQQQHPAPLKLGQPNPSVLSNIVTARRYPPNSSRREEGVRKPGPPPPSSKDASISAPRSLPMALSSVSSSSGTRTNPKPVGSMSGPASSANKEDGAADNLQPSQKYIDFHQPKTASVQKPSKAIPMPPSVGRSFPSQSTRAQPSSTLSAVGQPRPTSTLHLPNPSTKSANPFTRKTKKT